LSGALVDVVVASIECTAALIAAVTKMIVVLMDTVLQLEDFGPVFAKTMVFSLFYAYSMLLAAEAVLCLFGSIRRAAQWTSVAPPSSASHRRPRARRPLAQPRPERLTPSVDAPAQVETYAKALECVVCMGALRCVVAVPCRHMAMCVACHGKIMSTRRSCPLCRQPMQGGIEAIVS